MAILNIFVRAGFGRGLLGRGVRGLMGLVLVLLAGIEARGQSAASREYQIKAVFLFNFAQFVEWPPAAFSSAAEPLVVGVLGEDPFGNYLDEAVQGEKVGARPLVVRRYARLSDVDTCHVLFISRSEAAHVAEIVARLKDRSTLTVSDIDGAANHGVMIRFVNQSNHLRLRINLDAARAARLTISSKLLRPAEIVSPGKD